jgi:hypothetical protein
VLDVSENQIDDLRNIGCFERLIQLNLGTNNIASIELSSASGIGCCKHLKSLDLSNNPLVQVQGKPIDQHSLVAFILLELPELRSLSITGIPLPDKLGNKSLVNFNGKRIAELREIQIPNPHDGRRVSDRINMAFRRLGLKGSTEGSHGPTPRSLCTTRN